MQFNKLNFEYNIYYFFIVLFLAFFSSECLATTATTATIGDVAHQITLSFENIARLITASSYLAGLGFSIGAMMKFKQHKDNPTQIPVGTPVAMLFIASALLFLPSILKVTSVTMFGGTGGSVAGPMGTIFK